MSRQLRFYDRHWLEIIIGLSILGTFGFLATLQFFGVINYASIEKVCVSSHIGTVVHLNTNNKITYNKPREICDVWVYKQGDYTSEEYYSYDYQQLHQIKDQKEIK